MFFIFLITHTPCFYSIGYACQIVINKVLYIEIHLAIHQAKIKVCEIDTYVRASQRSTARLSIFEVYYFINYIHRIYFRLTARLEVT
jgi:hypothetical protein